jgi:hypothetical protein
VFTEEGTAFTDVSLLPDGQDLTYVAEHARESLAVEVVGSRKRGRPGALPRSFDEV